MAEQWEVRVEMMEGASRCRDFNAQGRQCGQYTKRVLVIQRPGMPAHRQANCGRHEKRS